MTWNLVAIIALVIVLALAGLGYKRGLIMSIWHLVSFVLIIGLTIWASPHVAKFAKNNEKIYKLFYSTIAKTVKVPAKSGDDIDKFIEGLHLPEKAEDVVQNFASRYYGDVEDVQKSFEEKVYEKLTDMTLTALSFLITLGLAALAVTIVFNMLDLVSKMPLLNMANKLGGIALGLAEGILIIWVACGIIPLFSATSWGGTVIEQIQANKILNALYEHNIVSTILSGKIMSVFK